MAKIVYRFADGTADEVEVSDEIAAVYADIVKYEQKMHRRERRHCCSIQAMLEKGHDIADPYADIEETLERESRYAANWGRYRLEERRLAKKRKELMRKLTAKQAQAYFEFTYLKCKKAEIARHMGITEGAVRKLILKAEKRLAELRGDSDFKQVKERNLEVFTAPAPAIVPSALSVDEQQSEDRDPDRIPPLYPTYSAREMAPPRYVRRERVENTEQVNFLLIKYFLVVVNR